MYNFNRSFSLSETGAGPSNSDKRVFSVPVSYTHLDVYKRQHTSFGKCTDFI